MFFTQTGRGQSHVLQPLKLEEVHVCQTFDYSSHCFASTLAESSGFAFASGLWCATRILAKSVLPWIADSCRRVPHSANSGPRAQAHSAGSPAKNVQKPPSTPELAGGREFHTRRLTPIRDLEKHLEVCEFYVQGAARAGQLELRKVRPACVLVLYPCFAGLPLQSL